MDLTEILTRSVDQDVSDIFIVPGAPVTLKIKGEMTQSSADRMMPADTEAMLRQIYKIAQDRDMTRLLETGDDDFSFSLKGVGRFRCNAFKQRGSLAAVLRVVVFGLPDPAQLHIPQQVIDACAGVWCSSPGRPGAVSLPRWFASSIASTASLRTIS